MVVVDSVNPVQWLKEPLFITGVTNNFFVTAGQLAFLRLRFNGSAPVDGESLQFSFPDYTGSPVIEFDFKTTPAFCNEVQAYVSGSVETWFLNYMLPAVQRNEFLMKFYEIDYNFSTPNLDVFIRAKNNEDAYNITLIAPPPSVSIITIDANVNAVYNDELYLVASLYKRLEGNGYIETWKHIADLKVFPTNNGDFAFKIDDVCLSVLKPFVKFNFYPDPYVEELHTGFGWFRVIVKESIEIECSTQTEFLGFYGGETLPKHFQIAKSDFYSTAIARRKLSNMPLRVAMPPDFIYCPQTINTVFDLPIFSNPDVPRIWTQYDFYPAGSASDLALALNYSPDMFRISYGFKSIRKVNLDVLASGAGQEFVKQLEIYQYNLNNTLMLQGETQKIDIDYKYYRNSNFFIFMNALGGTDVAWLNGLLEAEIGVDGMEYETIIQPKFDQMYGQFGKDKGYLSTSYKINTGWKTKEEIQWLLELVSSDLIIWMTKRQMSLFQDYIDGIIPQNMVQFQRIIIPKQKIKYYNSADGLHAFEFDFELAGDTITAPKIMR